MFFVFHVVAIIVLTADTSDASSIRCDLSGSIDNQYEASLALYRFFLSSFGDTTESAKNEPSGDAVKKILSGNRAAIFALFYAHIFDICNLVRIQEWVHENSKNLESMKVIQRDIVNASNKLADYFTQLEKNLSLIHISMEQDLQNITQHLHTLKNQGNQMGGIIQQVLQLRFLTMSIFALGAPFFYVSMFSLMYLTTNVNFSTLVKVFGGALVCEVLLSLPNQWMDSSLSSIFRLVVCAVINVWLWRSRQAYDTAVRTEEILEEALS